ncbi:hypothetical protein NQ318_012403 [Aromia moschata]|uniref:RING-type domain-containing protein n=1 Tax=Aromia moschata TaxID=1265417 RepID=A0AAV8Y4H6_9CUCU|nr:hypothetical protein NQ318_012403 [Aromia moschata]
MPLPTIPLLPIMLGLGLGVAVILFLVNRPQLEYLEERRTTYSPPVLVRPTVTTIRRRRANGRELTAQQSTETSSEKKPETCKSAKTSTEEKPDTCDIYLELLTHSLKAQQSMETSSEEKPETCKSVKTSTEEKPDTCAICLESLTHSLKALPCTHIFHEPCLKKCFSRSLEKNLPFVPKKGQPSF